MLFVEEKRWLGIRIFLLCVLDATKAQLCLIGILSAKSINLEGLQSKGVYTHFQLLDSTKEIKSKLEKRLLHYYKTGQKVADYYLLHWDLNI